jgi:hypothetical protein
MPEIECFFFFFSIYSIGILQSHFSDVFVEIFVLCSETIYLCPQNMNTASIVLVLLDLTIEIACLLLALLNF